MSNATNILRAGSILAVLGTLTLAQTPPPHPRMLFTAAQRPALQAKVSAAGTVSAQSFAACATSHSFSPASAQTSYSGYVNMRRMVEIAFRYQMTGNATYGNTAKGLLLQAANHFTPNANDAYTTATYPSVMALVFDWVYDRLSASERAQVVSRLESWVTVFLHGTASFAPYASFQGATGNYTFAFATAISFTLMAIEGDSNYPALRNRVNTALAKLESGWLDAISPDGSVDEWYGYANYGELYSMNSGIAARNCGYGDRLAGTNVLKSPRWLATSLAGSTFIWAGDSSASHKGVRMDPIVYYPLTRSDSADSAALWGLNRIFAIEPPSEYSPTHGWSPHVNRAMFYPENLAAQPPEVLSGFFRDNLNQGSAIGNKTINYPEIGDGGHAFMHNSSSSSWQQMTAYYMIRDEWALHSHEDDGHFGLASNGKWLYLDLGLADPSNWGGAQSTDHNIVLAQGASPYMGSNNNYYNPPPGGRFLGAVKETMLSPYFDYVRGDHRGMWMMQEAERSVIMIKDSAAPYMILMDRVNKDGTQQTYEELFHSAASASGQGTFSSPMTVSSGGVSMRAAWIAPANKTVVPGPNSNHRGQPYARNKVVASGTGVTFLSVHGRTLPSTTTPLVNPSAGTSGATLNFSFGADKVMSRSGGGTLNDQSTQSDARFVWLRRQGGVTVAYALAEGRSVVDQTRTLFTASRPVTAAIRGGRAFVETLDGSGVQGLGLAFYAPFALTTLIVDGTSEPFTQVGDWVTAGGVALPGPSEDDRAYSFLGGHVGDAVLSPTAFVTPAETLGASSGWANILLKGGARIGGRPLTVGMEVTFLPSHSGPAAATVLETATGAEDIVKCVARKGSSNTFLVQVSRGSTILGDVPLPLGVSGGNGRFTLHFEPAGGTVLIEDVGGQPAATYATPPFQGTFLARCRVHEEAFIDNITLFDSAEDGQTPQGLCFYATNQGYAGFVARTPMIGTVQDWRPVFNGNFVHPSIAHVWYTAGFLDEYLVTSAAPSSTSILTTHLKEAGWEFGVPAVHTYTGATTGMWMQMPSSLEMLGIVSF